MRLQTIETEAMTCERAPGGYHVIGYKLKCTLCPAQFQETEEETCSYCGETGILNEHELCDECEEEHGEGEPVCGDCGETADDFGELCEVCALERAQEERREALENGDF